MLLFSVFKTLTDQEVTVELKNDLCITGTLKSVDQFLNIRLDNIRVLDTERHPHMATVKNCFIRGSVVRYVQLPSQAMDTQLLEDATRRGPIVDSQKIADQARGEGSARRRREDRPPQRVVSSEDLDWNLMFFQSITNEQIDPILAFISFGSKIAAALAVRRAKDRCCANLNDGLDAVLEQSAKREMRLSKGKRSDFADNLHKLCALDLEPMDLAALKAELKCWEKSFKAKHGAKPQKEDVRANPHIAQQYKLYNNAIKATTVPQRQQPESSSSRPSSRPKDRVLQSPPTASKSRPSASERHGSPSFSTPTKPSPARVHQLNGTPSKPPYIPSRPVISSAPSTDNPFLSSSSAQSYSTTPQKRKHPPTETLPSSSKTASSSFHFVSSPKKLKALIASHSPSKSPNNPFSLDGSGPSTTLGLTPRTKARKRLRGEITGETPQKAPRRTFASTIRSLHPEAGGEGLIGTETGQDLMDLLGPSPVKAEDRSVARPLFRLEDVEEDERESDGSESDGMGSRRPVKLEKASLKKSKDGPLGSSKSAGALLKTFTQRSTMPTSSASTSKSSSEQGQPKRAHPFLFSTTTDSWNSGPAPTSDKSKRSSNDKPEASGSRSKSSKDKKPSSSSRRNDSDSDSSSTSTRPPPTKKPRRTVANGGVPKMNANQKAKSEAARKTLSLAAGEDDDADDGEERGSDEEEEGEKERPNGNKKATEGGEAQRMRIVRSRLMVRGESGETRSGRAAEGLPSYGKQTRKKEEEAELMDADELGQEPAWDERMEESFGLEMGLIVSPLKKKKKSNGLYGLSIGMPGPPSPASYQLNNHQLAIPDGHSHDDDNPIDTANPILDPFNSSATHEPHSDRHSSSQRSPSSSKSIARHHDLPPHLLSLLSLHSPEFTSARLAKSRAETYTSIFAPAHPAPSKTKSATAPPPSITDPKGKGKGRADALPISNPPARPAQARPIAEKKKQFRGEVWDVGQDGVDEEEGDDDWASEVEGWKEGRFGVGDDDEDW